MKESSDRNDSVERKKDLINSVSDGGARSQIRDSHSSTTEPRRGFLQKAAAVAAPLFASVPGLSNPVSAKPRDVTALQSEYEDSATMQAAVEQYASDLVSGLAERGLLEDASVETLLKKAETKVSAIHVEGMPTAHLEANLELPSGDILSIFVQPQAGRSYAFKREDYHEPATIYEIEGSGSTLSTSSSEGDNIGTTACTIGGGACYSTCSEMPDTSGYKETHCCTDGSCYTGSETRCCDPHKTEYSSCDEVCS